MAARLPALPPFTKPIVLAAIVLDIVVFAGLTRAFPVLVLMMVANLAVCLVVYWIILGQFFAPSADEAGDQSPSRKSSPISE